MSPRRRWTFGEVVFSRQRLGLQPDEVPSPAPAQGVWFELPVHVVEDGEGALVTFAAPGAPFTFPAGSWPSPNGLHPWHERSAWSGHGCLQVHVPGEHYAVWHFWDGPNRDFKWWYLNLQTAFLRTADGFDTQDLELDIIVKPDGSFEVKDAEILDDRVADGRWSPDLIEWIRHYGQQLVDRLEHEGVWWDRAWAEWTPPAAWVHEP